MTKKFKKLARNVYLVQAKTSQELAKLFLRFQEHYESPEFKDKIFTLAEFETWYKARDNAETFTYYDDWTGFNVPNASVDFVANNFPDLTEDEKWLIEQVKTAQPEGGNFYVIGAAKGSKITLKHETAHAMFYLDVRYKWIVRKILQIHAEHITALGQHLREIGYNESVVLDEQHAYILTERTYLKKHKLWIPEFNLIHDQLSDQFERHK